MDLTDSDKDFSSINVENEDLVLFAVPSFGGRVPAIATEKLARIKGNGTKRGVVSELEKQLNIRIYIPEHSKFCGALGVALIAGENIG